MKKVYGNFPFSHDIILKQNYIIISIPLSLVNIYHNYTGCINVFLDPQCIISQEDFQHKILNWSTLLPLLSLHTSRAGTMRDSINSEAIVKNCFHKNARGGPVLKLQGLELY